VARPCYEHRDEAGMRNRMMLHKFMFFFWIGMILFMSALGYVNFIAGDMLLVGVNAVTVVLASFNAQWTLRNINK
jgi:hypothetical protein